MTTANLYTGPETHVSPDKTENPQPVKNYHPTGDRMELFPKYKYHKTKEPVIVQNEDEEKALEGDWVDAPVPVTSAEASAAEEDSLDGMSRAELTAYAADKYGIKLDGRLKHDDLVAAIEAEATKPVE